MKEIEASNTQTFKVKSQGFERIFSNYNGAYTFFDKLVTSEKKKKQAFAITLLSKTGAEPWRVVDKITVKSEFFKNHFLTHGIHNNNHRHDVRP